MSNERLQFYGQGNPAMEVAFASCVEWCWKDPEARAAFRRDTGMGLAESPIEALIDKSTGYDEEVAEAFVRWVIENVWGSGE